MIKNTVHNWLESRRAKFQAWWDKPLEEKRRERAQALLEIDQPKPWREKGLDPVLQLPRTPLRQEQRTYAVAKIQGEPRRVSVETLAMLRAMDQVFLEGASQALDWMQVRVDRRIARNQQVAIQQGRQMFDGRLVDINQMTEDEAIEYTAAQARAILARARHASDPNGADTTSFTVVTA
jgi:uncharacterized membrane protein YqiK